MNIIYENKRKSESFLPHELNTRKYAVESYRNGNSISYVCRKYHISRTFYIDGIYYMMDQMNL